MCLSAPGRITRPKQSNLCDAPRLVLPARPPLFQHLPPVAAKPNHGRHHFTRHSSRLTVPSSSCSGCAYRPQLRKQVLGAAGGDVLRACDKPAEICSVTHPATVTEPLVLPSDIRRRFEQRVAQLVPAQVQSRLTTPTQQVKVIALFDRLKLFRFST